MQPFAPSALRRALAGAAAALCLAPVFAQQPAAPAAPAATSAPVNTLAKVAASKTITLGVRKDAQPFSYLDAAGKPAGFSWNLCQAVVQQIGDELKAPIAIRFETVSLSDSFDMLKAGKIDLHCGITSNTAPRQAEVDFSDTFYVSRVVAADKVLEEALAAAATICEYSLPAVMMAKEAVNRSFEGTLADGVHFERRMFHSLFATEDQKIGMQAFIDKQKPVFRQR